MNKFFLKKPLDFPTGTTYNGPQMNDEEEMMEFLHKIADAEMVPEGVELYGLTPERAEEELLAFFA